MPSIALALMAFFIAFFIAEAGAAGNVIAFMALASKAFFIYSFIAFIAFAFRAGAGNVFLKNSSAPSFFTILTVLASASNSSMQNLQQVNVQVG